MPERYFNWKLALVIILSILAVGITAFGLRQWRRTMRAENGLLLGNKAYQEHRYDEAAKQLGRYISINPNDVNALLKYADSQTKIRPLKSRNLQQTIAAYRSILRIDQANSEAAAELTGLYLSVNLSGEAELIAQRYCESNKDPIVRRNLALAYISQKKFDRAAKELKNIISDDPTQVSAYEMLGQVILQSPKDFNETADYWFNQAVKNNPSSAMAYVARAGLHRINNNEAMMLSDFQQAEQMDLSDMKTRLRLAMEYISLGKLEQAETHLSIIKKSEPQNLAMWQSWAQLALKSGSFEKMRNIAESGLKELSYQSVDFMPLAAELFIQSDNLGRAEECIKEMNQKEISPAYVAFLEGIISDRKGQSYEALKYWKRSIELGNRSLQTRLALVSAFSRLGDNQSALRQLEILVSEIPDSFDAHFALAAQQAQNGQWNKVEEETKKAISLSPKHLGAMLLNLQARSQLLVWSSAGQDLQAWQNIDKELAMLDKASDGALDVRLLRFRCDLLRDDQAAAESLLSEMKKQYPDNPKVVMSEALLFSARARPDQALSVLGDAIRKIPNADDLLDYYVTISVRQQKYADCVALIKELLERADKPYVRRRQTTLLLAQIYSLRGKEELAYNCLAELEKELPSDVTVKRQLLLCKKIRDNSQQAQQIIDTIKSIEGDDGWQWRYEQARVWYESGDFLQRYPQIVSILKENLLANPGDNTSRTLLAGTYSKAGDFQMAASTYNEALNNSPQDIRLIVLTIAALQKTKEYTRADEILAQTAKEKLFNPELRKLELQSRLIKGELKSAGQILEDMFADDPNNLSICLSLASLKIQQREYTEAQELLTRLRNQKPDLPAAIEKQVELYVRQNKAADAIALCDQTVNKFNNAYAYLLRGRMYAVQGQAEKANKDFEQAIIIEPNNVQTWLVKSDFERSIGRLENAAADVRHAISLEPNDLQIRKHAISLYLEFSKPEMRSQGINLLDEAMKTNSDDYQLKLLKVRSLLFDVNNLVIKQVTAILKSVTEAHPREREAWLLLGDIFLRYEQDPGEAMSVALKGLANNQNDKALLMLKARAEEVISPTSAVVTLKGILEQEPNDIDVILMLGETLLTNGQAGNAVAFLKMQMPAFGNTPYKYDADMLLARALYKSGNKNGAVEILDTLYRTDSNDPKVLLTHVRLLKDDKLWDQLHQKVALWYQQHPENKLTVVAVAGQLAADGSNQAGFTAENILNSVLKNDPCCTEAMIAIGMLYSSKGQSVQAAEIYRRILEITPDNVIAMNNLAWIFCEQGQYERALELAEKGLKMAPSYIDLVDTRGLIYSQMNKTKEAIGDFTRCVELYPPNTPSCTVSYYHLGKALYKTGEKTKAVNALKQAVKMNEKIGGLSQGELSDSRRLLEEITRGG
jgi:tetratricopeptide (TPR) repeat protein